MSDTPMMFASNPLDRAGHKRGDATWVEAQRRSGDALFVPFWHLQPLILPPLPSEDGRDVGWLPAAAFGPILAADPIIIFLGLNRRNKPLFAVDISALSDPEQSGPFAGMGGFYDLRELAAAGEVSSGDLSILAQAKAMIDWHLRHGYCSQCGSPSVAAEAGYKRVCGGCGAEHFPRTDPVVIMLATHGDTCLIGRQPGWPERMYSALAGFVEPGETIEAAVARELQEEAGIEVGRVRYIQTQPWPFPASLMMGCVAEATTTDIVIDQFELEDARWVSRADLQAAFAGQGDFAVPPALAIAHHLMRYFADNKA